MQNKKRLNLGAGEDRREGYININHNDLTEPDVVHDLNSFPYPFDQNTFDEILAGHIFVAVFGVFG